MLECEHERADGLDVEGMKGDIYENKGQVMAILMVRWRKAGTGWDQEFCFGVPGVLEISKERR